MNSNFKPSACLLCARASDQLFQGDLLIDELVRFEVRTKVKTKTGANFLFQTRFTVFSLYANSNVLVYSLTRCPQIRCDRTHAERPSQNHRLTTTAYRRPRQGVHVPNTQR